MPKTFEGRVALITGGGGGIGRAIARSFAAQGANVIIASRRGAPLEETLEEIARLGAKATSVTADVSSAPDVENLLDRIARDHGHLDILVNAAGVLRMGLLNAASEADFDATFATNVKGLWLVTKLAVPLMRGRDNANVINISSIAGTRTDPGIGIYEASKAAVNTLTKVMAKELAADRIRVNAIAPGPIDTELYQGSVFGDDGEAEANSRGRGASAVPFGRMGSPDEVARLACFLASPESDFISGSITSIDGAMGY